MSEKRLKDEETLRTMLRGQVRLSRSISEDNWSDRTEEITLDAMVDIVEMWANWNDLNILAAEEPPR